MIGHSNSEPQSQGKNSGGVSLDKLEESLMDRIKEAKAYASKMSNFLSEPQPQCGGVYGFASESGMPTEQPYDPRISYYHEFWKIYVRNENSLSQIKLLVSESAGLKERVAEIETLEEAFSAGLKSRVKKKARRLAIDIEKRFRCPYNNCYKLYGSNVSLNLHIKIKHNGGNKTDREKIAQQICIAELNKTPLPLYDITFPPGFLEAYRKEYIRTLKKEIRL